MSEFSDMMNFAKFFCAVFLILLISDMSEGRHVIEERSLISQVTALSKITTDLSKGDYVAFLIDVIAIVQDLREWPWPMRIALRLIKNLLQVLHPVYLWLSRVFDSFGSSGGSGGMIGNVETGIKMGASTLQRALSLFQNSNLTRHFT
ncbi:uncharacterized protein LOC108911551 [Anoplophora glabripennis]|uniref:uncharacterized protein LOC108911551 n=1 Tax=Anoplophora glabripennis TaxID=217634 RepID=UPI000874C007|nr:uncharacterized protein LOC108911551 [Anoplophora glabripennis]